MNNPTTNTAKTQEIQVANKTFTDLSRCRLGDGFKLSTLTTTRESSSDIGKTMAEMTREIMTAFVEGNLQIKRGAVYQRQQEQMQKQQEEVQKLYVAR